MIIKEIWKDIKGYKGLYQVSNMGRVKSLERINEKNGNQLLKERILKININKNRNNYCQVLLSKNRKTKTHKLHRLKNVGVKIKIVIDNIEYIFNTISQASKELNLNRGTIYNALKNKSKKNIKVCYI